MLYNDPKVSIIIPVYNAEKYIEKCIFYIIDQTLKDIEILIVNDGSTDNSKQILSDICITDERITLINQPNLGISEARNAALKQAKGNYIGFVDADDWVEPDMFETMFLRALKVNADIVICNANNFINNRIDSLRLNITELDINISKAKNNIIADFVNFKYDYSNWNKIYRNSIIKENTIAFNSKIRICEDLLFNLEFVSFAEHLIAIERPLYNYAIHSESIMATLGSKNFEEQTKLIIEFENFCTNYNFSSELKSFKKTFSEVYFYAFNLNIKYVSLNFTLKETMDYFLPIMKKPIFVEYLKNINILKYSLLSKIEILLLKNKYFETLLLFKYLKYKTKKY